MGSEELHSAVYGLSELRRVFITPIVEHLVPYKRGGNRGGATEMVTFEWNPEGWVHC